MTATYVGSSKTTTTGTSIGLPRPTGVQSGDLLIAAIASAAGNITAVPSGWSLLRDIAMSQGALRIYTKVAGSSEPTSYTWTSDFNGDHSRVGVAYRGATAIAAHSGAAGGSSANVTAPGVNAPPARLVGFFAGGDFSSSWKYFTPPAGMTERADVDAVTQLGLSVADQETTTSGDTGTRTATGSATFSRWAGALVAIANTPPNAPALTAPAVGASFDRSIAQRFDWDFSDPDLGDSQSKYDVRYRIVGTSSWTEVTGTTPNTFHDFTGGSFAAGDYEWQARTYDAQGAAGPYSSSSFFTAASAPPTPAITDPISGGTVGLAEHDITWSAPSQSAYQVRKVADNAGDPDPSTVYYDSGEVASTSARSAPLTFPVNDRYEHLQVRIKHDGLWSSWASIRVLVSYTPPPIPGVNLAASGTSLVVTVFNPTPGAEEPAVTHNEVYVDDGAGETRRVAELVPNGSWTYQTPRSGRDYAGSVRVVAVGDNGTRSSS